MGRRYGFRRGGETACLWKNESFLAGKASLRDFGWANHGMAGGDKPPLETDLAKAGEKRKKSGGIPPLFYCSRMRK